jgi:hypothetical protein
MAKMQLHGPVSEGLEAGEVAEVDSLKQDKCCRAGMICGTR